MAHRSYSVSAVPHGAVGFDRPGGAAKSRDAVMQCGFFHACARPSWGGPGGEPQGSPVLHRSVNPFGSAHPFDSGRRFVQRTGAHAMPHVTFQPVFTNVQVEQLESEYNATWGVKRRVLMALLSISSDALLDNIRKGDSDEVVISLAAYVAEYRVHLACGIELADSALARLQLIADYLDAMATQ